LNIDQRACANLTRVAADSPAVPAPASFRISDQPEARLTRNG